MANTIHAVELAPDELLRLSQLALVWAFGSYWRIVGHEASSISLILSTTLRASFLLLGTTAVCGVSGLLPGTVLALLGAGLSAARSRTESSVRLASYGAEIEALGAILAVGVVVTSISAGAGSETTPLIALPVATAEISTACFHLAFFLGAVYGGDWVVRGVLAKARSQPAQETMDQKHTAHVGRLIGMVERTVLFVTVVLGSYEAFGLLIAAKSLLRVREASDDHLFAEYVVVGTLASISVALGSGLAARFAAGIP